MDDLISRQASIDLIKSWSGGFDYIELPTYIAVRSFEQLPSEQPETCEYWDSESNFCALYRPSAQPEITVDQVIEFCEKNGLVVHSHGHFKWLLSRYEQGWKDGYTQGFRDATVLSKANNNATELSKTEDYR